MDTMVIVLIGAGVCCFVVGIALFVRLCMKNPTEEISKDLLDADYAENFQESFKNTGNIEDTLEELSNIYMGNQYMYNLVVDALEYIREGQGDYETALDSINVDNDIDIMKMHNAAIKKALGVTVSHEMRPASPQRNNSDNYRNIQQSTVTETNQNLKKTSAAEEEFFEEDEEEDAQNGAADNTEEIEEVQEPKRETVVETPGPKPEVPKEEKSKQPVFSKLSGRKKPAKQPAFTIDDDEEIVEDDATDDDDDLAGFKIG